MVEVDAINLQTNPSCTTKTQHPPPKPQAFQPELILVSSGFDAGYIDPLAAMMLSSEHFRGLGERLNAAARELCGGRIVYAHEGGYSDLYVPFCGHAVIEELSGVRSVTTVVVCVCAGCVVCWTIERTDPPAFIINANRPTTPTLGQDGREGRAAPRRAQLGLPRVAPAPGRGDCGGRGAGGQAAGAGEGQGGGRGGRGGEEPMRSGGCGFVVVVRRGLLLLGYGLMEKEGGRARGRKRGGRIGRTSYRAFVNGVVGEWRGAKTAQPSQD